MILEPVLPSLENDESSLRWSLIALVPLVWLASIDFSSNGGRTWDGREGRAPRTNLSSALSAALFLSVLYGVIFYVRFRANPIEAFSRAETTAIAFWVLSANFLIAAGIFVIIALVRSVAARFGSSAKLRFILYSAVGTIAGALVVRKLALAAVSFDGYLADIYALLLSLSVALFLGGIVLRRMHRDAGHIDENSLRPSALGRLRNSLIARRILGSRWSRSFLMRFP